MGLPLGLQQSSQAASYWSMKTAVKSELPRPDRRTASFDHTGTWGLQTRGSPFCRERLTDCNVVVDLTMNGSLGG